MVSSAGMLCLLWLLWCILWSIYINRCWCSPRLQFVYLSVTKTHTDTRTHKRSKKNFSAQPSSGVIKLPSDSQSYYQFHRRNVGYAHNHCISKSYTRPHCKCLLTEKNIVNIITVMLVVHCMRDYRYGVACRVYYIHPTRVMMKLVKRQVFKGYYSLSL